jgi:sugar O-acyltransferase (sialic acid O-acetyltransferase NeuD family)
MANLILFGTGHEAMVAHTYFSCDTDHHIVAFTADANHIEASTFMNLPVVPFEDVATILPPASHKMHIPIAYTRMNKLRAEKYDAAKRSGYELVTYISSKATVWPDLRIGDNSFVAEHVVIQPYACIGNNVVINPGSHIGHHTTVRDHCFLSVNVTILGGVTVEPYCMFGGNATVRNLITVARETVVGAGALILRDTRERGVYVGNASRLHPVPSNELADQF